MALDENGNGAGFMPIGLTLPRRIARLGELAYNLWWTWNPEAQRVFHSIDPQQWEDSYHNPVDFLRAVKRQQLNAVTYDRHYLDLYDRVFNTFDQYIKANHTWTAKRHPEFQGKTIAYFSSEFGLHESLPIYAGGLGVLSGDHVKEASDLGLPMVGVGFLYTLGYFSQHITEDGWQEAVYNRLVFDDLPVLPVTDEQGLPVKIDLTLPGRQVFARIWKIQVGRVPLYLLDTDVEPNSASDRELTSRLYISDLELRISQQMILGIGGVRALRRLGIHPGAWHMNEGHSAFVGLERLSEMVEAGVTHGAAVEDIKATTVFTTHTPVPAGNDEFPLWLTDKYFAAYWPTLGLARDEFNRLGLHHNAWGDTFSMPVLAIKLSDHRNGVSELHGQVSRRLWQFLYPGTPEDRVPIGHITNGVHTLSWLARRLRNLFNRHLPEDWEARLDDPEVWRRLDDIPDADLWAARLHLKRKLSAYIRDRARDQWLYDGVHPVQVVAAGVLLDPYALTIGFARRFATYKRANLILRDVERLLRIVHSRGRPVQFIFAGKAHPADEPGKLLIQEVYRRIKTAETAGRLVFLEDYDMNLARYLVQGVDVWLNTPRRPLEASGTSGEKAAINGVLNFSVMDGWWREGYDGTNGWAIGDDRSFDNPEAQDAADAESLYDTLENQIVPLFYDERSADGLPNEWIHRMKNSIRTLAPLFSTRRMLKEYVEQMYVPALASASRQPTANPADG